MIPLLLASLAAGAVRAGVGISQARKEGKRQKGIIGKAYTLGKTRQNLRQGDVRQSVAESSIQRGLAQGGTVQTGMASSPLLSSSVAGAHDLGGQQTADLAREQNLESYSLLQDRDRALSDVKAGQNAATIASIGAGINTGAQVYGMGAGMGSSAAAQPGASPAPMSVGADNMPAGWNPSRTPGTFMGIDVLNPVGGRAVATADFNKFGANG